MTTPIDNISVPRELLRQAIDALAETETDGESTQWDLEKAAYDALRAALFGTGHLRRDNATVK